MIEETLTPEQIAKHYSAAMDSVNLLNAGKPAEWSDDDWTDCVSRNVEHLQIMVAKDYWTTEVLSPINTAISTHG